MMSESEKVARLLGERLKTIRKEMKLKQSVFAHLIGTSDDTISLMERGKILPRLKTLCKIAEHLKIPLSKLLDFQEKSKTGKSENQPLSALNLYLKTKLPQEVQLVHDLAKGIFNKVPSIYPVRSVRRDVVSGARVCKDTSNGVYQKTGRSLRPPVRDT